MAGSGLGARLQSLRRKFSVASRRRPQSPRDTDSPIFGDFDEKKRRHDRPLFAASVTAEVVREHVQEDAREHAGEVAQEQLRALSSAPPPSSNVRPSIRRGGPLQQQDAREQLHALGSVLRPMSFSYCQWRSQQLQRAWPRAWEVADDFFTPQVIAEIEPTDYLGRALSKIVMRLTLPRMTSEAVYSMQDFVEILRPAFNSNFLRLLMARATEFEAIIGFPPANLSPASSAGPVPEYFSTVKEIRTDAPPPYEEQEKCFPEIYINVRGLYCWVDEMCDCIAAGCYENEDDPEYDPRLGRQLSPQAVPIPSAPLSSRGILKGNYNRPESRDGSPGSLTRSSTQKKRNSVRFDMGFRL